MLNNCLQIVFILFLSSYNQQNSFINCCCFFWPHKHILFNKIIRFLFKCSSNRANSNINIYIFVSFHVLRTHEHKLIMNQNKKIHFNLIYFMLTDSIDLSFRIKKYKKLNKIIQYAGFAEVSSYYCVSLTLALFYS